MGVRYNETCAKCECLECELMDSEDGQCKSPAHIAKGYCRCACAGCKGKNRRAIINCYFRVKGGLPK